MMTAIGEIAGHDEVVGGGALSRRRKGDKHGAALAACDRDSRVTRRFVPIDLKSRRRPGRHLGLESEARDHQGALVLCRIHEAYQMFHAGCTCLHSAEVYLPGSDS